MANQQDGTVQKDAAKRENTPSDLPGLKLLPICGNVGIPLPGNLGKRRVRGRGGAASCAVFISLGSFHSLLLASP